MMAVRYWAALPLLLAVPVSGQPPVTNLPDQTPVVRLGSLAEVVAGTPTLATLARAVASADFAAMLGDPGPFTLFAPSDAAWARLAPGTLDTLLLPEHRPTLVRLLKHHIVPGRLTAADLHTRVTAGTGRATLTSLAGGALTLTLVRGVLMLTDEDGNLAYVEVPDGLARNGLVHRVNGIVVPK